MSPLPLAGGIPPSGNYLKESNEETIMKKNHQTGLRVLVAATALFALTTGPLLASCWSDSQAAYETCINAVLENAGEVSARAEWGCSTLAAYGLNVCLEKPFYRSACSRDFHIVYIADGSGHVVDTVAEFYGMFTCD